MFRDDEAVEEAELVWSNCLTRSLIRPGRVWTGAVLPWPVSNGVAGVDADRVEDRLVEEGGFERVAVEEERFLGYGGFLFGAMLSSTRISGVIFGSENGR
jgi:hypothetical protein